MRSKFAEHFNHNDDAEGYDLDVWNEQDPIRAGYAVALDWVVSKAELVASSTVLELGGGTGNLTLRLPRVRGLVSVDISEKMTRIARGKLADRSEVSWIVADLLEVFDRPRGPFDAVLSTYAIHHLTESEKAVLFEKIRSVLVPGGSAVFADLMFADSEALRSILKGFRRIGRGELADVEFFWDVTVATARLTELGFALTTTRFSALSWGIAACVASGG